MFHYLKRSFVLDYFYNLNKMATISSNDWQCDILFHNFDDAAIFIERRQRWKMRHQVDNIGQERLRVCLEIDIV